jgi:hypothetical protein
VNMQQRVQEDPEGRHPTQVGGDLERVKRPPSSHGEESGRVGAGGGGHQ